MFTFMRKRSTPDPPRLPLLEIPVLPIAVEAPAASVDPLSPAPKKVRAKRSLAAHEAPAEAMDENTALGLLRQHIFTAAEAERKLAVAVEALRKIADGEKHPDRLAKSTLAHLAK
jgi:hypothetical protein